MSASDTTVLDVLDELPVTDTVYHDLAYTRPLTARLLEAVAGRPKSDRILLVGPNVALAQALIAEGRPVEIWHVPGVAIIEELRPKVTRVASLDALFEEPTDRGPFDVVVLPYVLDSVKAEPAHVLSMVRGINAPGGIILVTARRAGSLQARLRAFTGRSILSAGSNLRHSWSWPSAGPHREFDIEGMRAAARSAGFRLAAAERVVDSQATAGVDALPTTLWLRALVAGAAKRALPALRDTLVATLTPFSGRPGGDWLSGDIPTVSVVVVGDDPDRAMRVVGDLEEQTYPRDSMEIAFAAPGAKAANAALHRARGEIVAFTDDFSRPPAGWVESGVRAMVNYTAALAGGVLAAPGSAAPFLAMPDRGNRTGGRGLYLVANSFYVREAVLSVGGFDEGVGRAWGWDSTAAGRLRSAGFPIEEDATAFVFRDYPFPPDRSWIREEFQRTHDLPAAVRRDPSLRRRALHHRYFASARTCGFDVAVLGLSVAVARRRSAYALVLALPWMRSVVEYVDLWPAAEWRTSMRHLRGIVLRNVIWLAGLSTGSARARRVVL
jgi:hypothetical protein